MIKSFSSLTITACVLTLFSQFATAVGSLGAINDTGITLCEDASDTRGACTTTPRQDGRYGRDAAAAAGQLTKIGAGVAGFDFTKIANNGTELPADAVLGSGPTDWACTRDNVTGILWKTVPSNILTFDDAAAYATAVNTAGGLCGFTDWRVPTVKELHSIVNLGTSTPSFDTNYFPNPPLRQQCGFGRRQPVLVIPTMRGV